MVKGRLKFINVVLRGYTGREREIKTGAVTHLALGPNAPAVAMNDPLDNGQADAGAFKLVFTVQALKDAKKFINVLRIEAGSVIAHGVDIFLTLPATANFDEGPFLIGRKFDGVGQEIMPYLPNQTGIPNGRG